MYITLHIDCTSNETPEHDRIGWAPNESIAVEYVSLPHLLLLILEPNNLPSLHLHYVDAFLVQGKVRVQNTVAWWSGDEAQHITEALLTV